MFDTLDGLPVHTLVVHAVVVLLPLGVLGTIAIAVHPAWRRTHGRLVVGVLAVATALVPVAVLSGAEFKKRVGDPGHHDQLGRMLIWFALPVLVLAVILVVLDRRDRADGGEEASSWAASPSPRTTSTGTASTGTTVVAALAVVAAVACGVQVYRVGESGARAAWGAVVQSTNQ
ncbi:DUF2231 domain-containing protein [Marmoricola sp. RAF53]|uniref:DUF2231 domain-containing protein n=1 Tax=Marmoricola sp. RAF53 TaxID=3233059 RepID=UPI003F9D4062